MDCSGAQELFNAYHEERLSPELRDELERHLESCPACAKLEKELRSIHEAVAELFKNNPLPADFEQRVVEALPLSGRIKAARWRRRLAWAATAAAAVLVITLLYTGIWSGETPVDTKKPEVVAKETPVQPSTTSKKTDGAETQPDSRPELPKVPDSLVKKEADQTGAQKTPEPQLAKKAGTPGKSGTAGSLSPKNTGHGKPGGVGSELLVSPPEAHPKAVGQEKSPGRKPGGIGKGVAGLQHPESPWSAQLTDNSGNTGPGERIRRTRERRDETVRPSGMHPKLAGKISKKKHPGVARRTGEHPQAAGKRRARMHPQQARRIAKRRAFLKKHPKFAKLAKKHPEKTRQIARRRFREKYPRAAETARKHPEALRKLIQRRKSSKGSPTRPEKPERPKRPVSPKRPVPPKRTNPPRRPNPPGRPKAPANGARPNR